MKNKIIITPEDRARMKNTVAYGGTILGLHFRFLGKAILQTITFNPDAYLTLSRELVEIQNQIKELEKHPETIFFSKEELKRVSGSKTGLDKVNDNQL